MTAIGVIIGGTVGGVVLLGLLLLAFAGVCMRRRRISVQHSASDEQAPEFESASEVRAEPIYGRVSAASPADEYDMGDICVVTPVEVGGGSNYGNVGSVLTTAGTVEMPSTVNESSE
jgi:hypothetical protein